MTLYECANIFYSSCQQSYNAKGRRSRGSMGWGVRGDLLHVICYGVERVKRTSIYLFILFYLEEGNNGLEIVLEFIERHVLKATGSIGKGSIVRTKEHRHRQRRVIIFLRWKHLVYNLQSPPGVIPTITS